MKNIYTLLRRLTFLGSFIGATLVKFEPCSAECQGKVDVAPAFLHVDILESGRTVKTMDMAAIRLEASYLFYKNFCVKPVVVYGNGGAAKGGICSGTITVGPCLPINSKTTLFPSVGIGYSHLWTKINLPQLQLKNLKENFKSISPLIGIDITHTISPGLRATASVQYAWARTHTSIAHLLKSKSNSKGFNYGALIEKDLTDQWSINLGVAYNVSLSKEKHGIRGTGIKIGAARWF
jgi:opacity protein-like surface antigen